MIKTLYFGESGKSAVCLEKCEIEEENSLFNEKKIGNLNLGTARSDQKEITDA